jgi:hypothetical protein
MVMVQRLTCVTPSVSIGFLNLPTGNTAKVAGAIAAQCSLGSLILGVHYARQHHRDLTAKNEVRTI